MQLGLAGPPLLFPGDLPGDIPHGGDHGVGAGQGDVPGIDVGGRLALPRDGDPLPVHARGVAAGQVPEDPGLDGLPGGRVFEGLLPEGGLIRRRVAEGRAGGAVEPGEQVVHVGWLAPWVRRGHCDADGQVVEDGAEEGRLLAAGFRGLEAAEPRDEHPGVSGRHRRGNPHAQRPGEGVQALGPACGGHAPEQGEELRGARAEPRQHFGAHSPGDLLPAHQGHQRGVRLEEHPVHGLLPLVDEPAEETGVLEGIAQGAPEIRRSGTVLPRPHVGLPSSTWLPAGGPQGAAGTRSRCFEHGRGGRLIHRHRLHST